jgi:glycerophosphoryl diester phosphodiesterase
MKIIAHRGGAGMALENSATAFKKAVKLGVDSIELDVHLTKDRHLVVNHDASLSRTSGDPRRIANCTWDELKDVKLKDGSPLLLLEDALQIIGTTEVLIELKAKNSAAAVLKVLAKFPKANAIVISFKFAELIAVKQIMPEQACYGVLFLRPFHAVRLTKKYQLDGFSTPLWDLPIVALLGGKRDGYVWTINSRLVVKVIHQLFPRYAICTNHPERLIVKS